MSSAARLVWLVAATLLLAACAGAPLRGTGDLGLVIERASGHVTLVSTTSRSAYARIGGLGDLSHASVVYSRDARYAYVFGRDGGLSKIDLLEARLVKRVIQSGNAIGGSISQDGRIVVAQNYTPGGIKAFDAETLELAMQTLDELRQGGRTVGLISHVEAMKDALPAQLVVEATPRGPSVIRQPVGAG